MFNKQYLKHPKNNHDTHRGFTIVELLIVVVIIAILAAITIVAYNGVQNRSKASAAQASAKQAGTKILNVASLNADVYPSDFAATGLQNGNGTTYQYRTTPNKNSFCVTTTTQNVSYFVSSTSAAAAAGGCPGHSVDGASIPTITNLTLNPSLESDFLGWAGCTNCVPSRTTGSIHGSYVARTAVNTTGGMYIYAGMSGQTPIVPGDVVYASIMVRNTQTTTRSFKVDIVWRNAGNPVTPQSSGDTIDVGPGEVAQLTVIGTAPAGSNSAQVQARSPWAVAGDVYDWDAVFMAKGAGPYGYADGNTSGWAWTGAANNSTSYGPAT